MKEIEAQDLKAVYLHSMGIIRIIFIYIFICEVMKVSSIKNKRKYILILKYFIYKQYKDVLLRNVKHFHFSGSSVCVCISMSSV